MDKGMLRKLVLITMISSPVYAVAPGFYMGLMAGPATNSAGNQQVEVSKGVTTTAKPRSNMFGSRLYLGYKVNQYAGVEGGLNYFSTVRFDTGSVHTCSGVEAW